MRKFVLAVPPRCPGEATHSLRNTRCANPIRPGRGFSFCEFSDWVALRFEFAILWGAQVRGVRVNSTPPHYLAIQFTVSWNAAMIEAHITLINGRCGVGTEKDRSRLQAHIENAMELDLKLAHVPAKPLFDQNGVARGLTADLLRASRLA